MDDQKNRSWKEAGQLSIFLGMVLLVVTTFVAFVVNVGLFVKAKINLQNSVDAAAFSGAAVQARQLTNIAYLNWEMRNTYKEWLFKYYILGNIGLDSIDNIDGNEPPATGGCNGGVPLNPGDGMNFRLRQFKGTDCRYYEADIYDRYNVPSVCIHFGSNNNICEIVTLPGLPRFNTVGLPSISEQHEAFLNSIVKTKADDCSNRSNINLGATMLWTYGTGNANLFPGVPEIAPQRVGAWVEAIELALRVRNLEAIVNTPPEDTPICRNDGAASATPCVPIADIMNNGSSLPFNERTVKAFWSAYRNLSGGVHKEANLETDFASTFTLKELAPNAFSANESSLSGFLIPAGQPALQKYYLDLKVMPVNYAMFYTSFYPSSGSFAGTSGTPPAEAKCGGTKTAVPVPGYIMGFVKNPEVLTYYAVEGQAKFVGLFYPFSDTSGITLKTYAAAKPFGGRIGPLLFDAGFVGNENQVKTSDDANKRTSANYISAFDTSTLGGKTADELLTGGFPLPTVTDFWVTSSGSAVVGGNPTESGNTGFGLPNLIYDFDTYGEIQDVGFGSSPINVLQAAPTDQNAYIVIGPEKDYGLYRKEQFRKFKANKVGSGGAAIFSIDQIMQSIHRVRRATRYEALNYLIPLLDVNGDNPTNMDGNSYVQYLPGVPSPTNDVNTQMYRIFAPLYGPDTLYNNPNAITSIIDAYILENSSAIQTYNAALEEIATSMRNAASRGGDAYVTAANSIYPADGNVLGNFGPSDPECDNLAMVQKFNMFFSTEPRGCGITPLGRNTTEYFANGQALKGPDFPYYYRTTWQAPTFASGPADGSGLQSALSAYMPGPRQGAEIDGTLTPPFSGTALSGRRNFYSTKFIPIKKVMDNGDPYGTSGGFDIFIDPPSDDVLSTTSLVQGARMRNTLDSGELGAYGSQPAF